MKKVIVNKNECVGCGNCCRIAEDVFKFDDEGLAKVVVESIPDNLTSLVIEAIEECPTNAIKEVK